MSLKSQIESLLFVSNRPLKIPKIANLIGASEEEVSKILEELYEEYKNREGGIKLFKIEDEWQLGTAPDNYHLVADFLQEELSGELTRPQLETLTIIAYRGPIIKSEIEQIRGVNCSLILRNLMIRGLIESKTDEKRHLVYYSVTMDFLKFLGLTSVEELPDYSRLHSHEVIEAYLKQTREQS
jgi:segregation and condensation protein B